MALYKFDFMLCYVNANRRHTLLMHSITGGCRYISNYQEWTGVKRERGNYLFSTTHAGRQQWNDGEHVLEWIEHCNKGHHTH